MFGTDIHITTLVLLIVQAFILFAQTLFWLLRPEDKSRLRFLALTYAYFQYNLFSGLFPDDSYSLNILIQNIIAYAVGIIVAVYFIYYIYKEFDIHPIPFFKVKTLLNVLTIAFLLFFIIPYVISKDLIFSKHIFILIPLMVSLLFLYQVGKKLLCIYKGEHNKKEDKYFRYRVISGYLGLFTLSLMPFIVAIGDYQHIEQPIVNSGYLIMMVVYILDFIYTSRLENHILYKTNVCEENKMINLSNEIIDSILHHLDKYEKQKGFLEKKISIHQLSKIFDTNHKYLSVVINHHKGKTFSQYINDLRVEYAIQKLNKDTKFRKYNIQYIASSSGFNKADTFSNAFKKKTGIYPSQFIKELEA